MTKNKKIDQALVIILDIGNNVSTPDGEGGEIFFQKARLLISRIIERKIISQENHYIGIILLGSKKSNNPLAEKCEGSYRHIEISVPLQKPTWQMMRDLPEITSKSKGSWFDALLVGANHLKNGIGGVTFLNRKIILVTNFQAPSHLENDNIEKALHDFKEENYEVDVIGPDLNFEENPKNLDIELARQFVESTKGSTATFENAMRYLMFHKKTTDPSISKVDLSIGPNINIPVCTSVRINNKRVVKLSKPGKDSKSKLVTKGYHYGQQIIPITDCDIKLLYKSGPKSLSIYGFTSYDNISWQNLKSDGLTYVFGRKNDEKSQKALTCLIQCLSELNLVGIVRRVYNDGNAPNMYALIPVIDVQENLFCLSLIGLCFKEDLKNMTFPPTNLKKYDCTDKQVDAFKDLIKAMNLMQAYEETEYDDIEAFPIARTSDPTAQYIIDCISFRALNPGKPLPAPREEIKLLFQVPRLVVGRSKEALDALKGLFPLNKIERTNPINKQSSSNVDEELKNSSLRNEELNDNIPKIKSKHKVGTLDPIKDYEDLKIEGMSQKELSSQMSEAIQSMIINNIDGDFTKAFNAMAHFREDCVKNDPTQYNDWLKNFKFQLTDLKKQDIINIIKAKNLNLILKCENNRSNLKFGEDSEMYEYDTAPMLTDVNINSEINDIFDNM